MGDKKEQKTFYQTVKQLLSLNLPVKIIISIREEYYGHLYDFEKIVPEIYRKKLRIEQMTSNKVGDILRGINNPEKSTVTLPKGEEEILIQAIFDKLRTENKIGFELPDLQMLLDELYLQQTHDEQYKTEAVLNMDALNRTGAIGEILFSRLGKWKSQLQQEKNIVPETVDKMLLHFITSEGTKQPLSKNALSEKMPEIESNTLIEMLQFFVNKRILRFDNGVYEIAHDTLAKQLYDNRSEKEIGRQDTKEMINSRIALNELFTEKEIVQIEMYFNDNELSQKELDALKKSRNRGNRMRFISYIVLPIVIAIIWLFASYLPDKRQIDEYYTDYVFEKETVKGIFPVCDTLLNHLDSKYHFIYNRSRYQSVFGQSGRLEKVIYEDANGNPQEHPFAELLGRQGEAIQEFIYKKDTLHDVIVRNKNGALLKSKEPVWSSFKRYQSANERFLLDSLGRRSAITYWYRGNRVINENDIWEITIEYDEMGNIAQTVCKNRLNYDIPNKEGWSKVQIQRDVFGNMIRKIIVYEDVIKIVEINNGAIVAESYFDKNGKPCMKDGISRQTFKYNGSGLMTEKAFFDTNYNPVPQNGSTKEKIVYDAVYSDTLSIAFYMSERPFLIKKFNGKASYSQVIDYRVKNSVQRDTSITVEKTGYSYNLWINVRQEYDSIGKLRKRTYSSSVDSMSYIDYLQSKREFDDNGYLISDFVAIKTPTNYFRTIIEEYNDSGHIESTSGITDNGKILVEGDYYQIKYQSDERGNMLEKSFLSSENKPVKYIDSKNRYATMRCTYDESDFLLSESYFGIENEPVVADYYATLKRKHSKAFGFESVGVAFYDADGKLCANQKGANRIGGIRLEGNNHRYLLSASIYKKFPFVRVYLNIWLLLAVGWSSIGWFIGIPLTEWFGWWFSWKISPKQSISNKKPAAINWKKQTIYAIATAASVIILLYMYLLLFIL
ncbi:MAG: hypothetical protein LBR66_05980 [Candidatus Symbiothrix sp.]|nr:hypothetical protein [Candidatus Symbiothrix sp.]